MSFPGATWSRCADQPSSNNHATDDPGAGLPAVTTSQTRSLTDTQRALKRSFDLMIGIVALGIVLPALIIISCLIWLDSGGPVLFRQRRRGLNCRPFDIYKFRTMRTLDNGPIVEQVGRNDPRVTRVGRILRKFSLDELPQILNVIRGEMSFVGPRPHAVAHDDVYSALISFYSERHCVKPGITGWAQINGWRGATPSLESMVSRVEHDLWYLDHWSLFLDAKILFRTLACVVGSENAY